MQEYENKCDECKKNGTGCKPPEDYKTICLNQIGVTEEEYKKYFMKNLTAN